MRRHLRLFLSLLLATTLSLGLAACGPKTDPPKTERQYTFTSGDPRELIAGTLARPDWQLDPKSDRQSYAVRRIHFFSHRTKMTERQLARFLKGQPLNQPSAGAVLKLQNGADENSAQFRALSPGGSAYEMSLTKNSGGSWRLTHFGGQPVELVHFDQVSNGGLISLLLLVNPQSEAMLVYLWLLREDHWALTSQGKTFKFQPTYMETKLAETYYFLMGTQSGWRPKTLAIQSHITTTDDEHRVLVEAVRDWNEGLKGFFQLSLGPRPEVCPPFSDFKSQCVYFFDQFQTTFFHDFSNPGQTLVTANPFENSLYQFLDADILLFRKELNKGFQDDTKSQAHRLQVQRAMIAHELGHLLGLNHPPNPRNPSQPTIMGYQAHTASDFLTRPTDYDFRALRFLYRAP